MQVQLSPRIHTFNVSKLYLMKSAKWGNHFCIFHLELITFNPIPKLNLTPSNSQHKCRETKQVTLWLLNLGSTGQRQYKEFSTDFPT